MFSLSRMYFEQGEAKGLKEGILEGHAKGREEGILEGQAKGRQEGILEGQAKGILEGQAKGRQEGHTSGLLESIRALHKNLKKTFEEAMDLLNVPEAKRSMYLELLRVQ